MSGVGIVYRKELLDALRDRRTLLAVFFSSVVMGPLMLLLLSTLIGDLEKRAEQRTVMIVGGERAPTFVNYVKRQTYEVKTPPSDYEQQLAHGKFGEAVIVVPPDFQDRIDRGEEAEIEVLANSANSHSSTASRQAMALLQGYAQEQSHDRLIDQGVAAGFVLRTIKVQDHDLASPQARAARYTGMVPFFVLMAVLYGAMTAALDTTAGERERGSLEPLLMSPLPRLALVVGKWGAVASLGMLISLLSCLSFLPAKGLIRSESLAAMFQFGLREVTLFVALLIPFAAALAALLMAVAIRAKTVKEAQANNAGVMLLVSLLPMVSLFNPDSEAAWFRWVPALGQLTLMNRVLKGETVSAADVALPLAVCLLLCVLCLLAVARGLSRATR